MEGRKSKAPKRTAAVWLRCIVCYLTGMFLMALGTSISVCTDLGVSPVSSVPFVLSRIGGVALGTMSILVYLVFVLLQIAVLRRKFRRYQLLQIVCAVILGRLITLTSRWVVFLRPTHYAERLLLCLVSIVIMAVGVKLYLAADLIPNPADGLVIALSQTFGCKFADVKNGFDFASVVLAALLSLIAFGSVAGVREGTVFAAVGVGRILSLLHRMDKGRLHAFLFAPDGRFPPAAFSVFL